MQLLFMWIEESDNSVIRNQNFNISGKLFFEYEFTTKTLNVKVKADYIEDFFQDNESIIDITAVVGTNGSGKTTFLNELLKHNIILDLEKKPKIIIAYKESKDDSIKIVTTAEIVNIAELETKYKIAIIDFEKIHTLNFTMLYVTNSFYGNKQLLSSESYKKIETFFLSTKSLTDNSRLLFDKRFEWDKEREIINSYEYFKELLLSTPSYLFERFETENQIEYVMQSKTRGDMLFAPEEIIFSVNSIRHSDIQYLKGKALNNKNALNFVDNINTLRTHYKFWLEKENEHKTEDLAHKLLFNLLVESQSVLNIKYRGSSLIPFEEYLNLFKSFLIKEKSKNQTKFKNYEKKYHEAQNTNTFFDNDRLFVENKKRMFDYYIGACDELKSFSDVYHNKGLNQNEFDKHDLAHQEFLLLNMEKDRAEISEILKLAKRKYSFISKYIKLGWRKISDGEYAFLALFSRVYWFMNENKKSIRDTLVVLFDEIDMYLHPEWQRKLINYLISDIQYIDKQIKIQIIFTTHSPITLSDMPKGNVIFMKRQNAECIVDTESHKQTFASNIYTLFNDSFFLDTKKGLVGEHALLCLNKVIRILDKKKLTSEDAEYIDNLINIMGDELIKKMLISMKGECERI